MGKFLRFAIVAICGCVIPDLSLAQMENTPNTAAFAKPVGEDALATNILKIAAAPDGGILASGFYNPKKGGGDAWLLKLNNKGDLIWEKRFPGEGSCIATELPDGNIISGSGSGDLIIRKLDQSGQILWEKTFAPQTETHPGYEPYLKAIEVQKNGSVVAVGPIDAHDYSAYRLLRLDFNGSLLQDQTFGAWPDSKAAPRNLAGLALLPDGSFAAAGNAGSNSDGWVMWFDASGALQWEHVWGGETDFRNVVAAPDGGVLIYAHSRKAYKPTDPAECDLVEGGSGCPCLCDGDLWLVRLSASGKVLWEKTYLKMSADGAAPNAIAALEDGAVVLSGFASREPYEPLMLRFDADGNLIAEQRGTHISAIGALPDGGVALAGWPANSFKRTRGPLSISSLPPDALKASERKEHK